MFHFFLLMSIIASFINPQFTYVCVIRVKHTSDRNRDINIITRIYVSLVPKQLKSYSSWSVLNILVLLTT